MKEETEPYAIKSPLFQSIDKSIFLLETHSRVGGNQVPEAMSDTDTTRWSPPTLNRAIVFIRFQDSSAQHTNAVQIW